jgi:hypothetical protein
LHVLVCCDTVSDMTNTEIALARWTTSSRTAVSAHRGVYELLRVDAPADEVRALFIAMSGLRGAHRVEIRRQSGRVVDGAYVESLWFSISFRGTERAVHGASNLLMLSGLQALDSNADHDHAACIKQAQSMGVPAAYAHTPETYLSA